MEKLQQRPSGGGGAKLGTLDMQSYLAVMGQQLAEIQAQHHEFCSSRTDRYGRAAALRNQEPGQDRRINRSSSAVSPSASRQQGIHTPPGTQGVPDGRSQGSTPSSGDSNGGVAAASSGQSGARRSLNFADGTSAEPGPSSKPAGRSGIPGPRPKPQQGLRTSLSTPPPMRGLSMDHDEGVSQSATAAARPRRQQQAGAAESMAAHPQARSRTPPKHSPGAASQRSTSPSVTPSISPSSASFRPQHSASGTPASVATSSQVSTSNTPRGTTPPAAARRISADSSVETSPALGAYVVYDASGVASVSYGTPASRPGGDRPHTGTSVSSSSQAAWRSPRDGPDSRPPTAGHGVAGALGTPSSGTVSAMSSALAVHNRGLYRPEEETVSEEEGLPHPLALAGRAFDGIDSEEDDEEDAVSQPEIALGWGSRGVAGAGAGDGEGSSAAGARSSLQQVGGSQPGSQSGVPPALRPPSAATARPPPRPPLVAASLETEDALRALLASPRLLVAGFGGGVSASIDAGGLEVPDDVLAALASNDGRGLDAALGAAMATTIREHTVAAAAALQAGPGASRPSTQGQGRGGQMSPVAGAAAQGHRHPGLVGPGALTAAPATVPAAATARGFDVSLRGGAAGGGHNATSGRGGVTAAGTPSGGSRGGAHQLPPPVDASISLDQLDMLGRTMEIEADTNALMRGSVAIAAAAMATQRAVAAAHAQPVLYSLGPRLSESGLLEETGGGGALSGEVSAVALAVGTVGAGGRPGSAAGPVRGSSAGSSLGGAAARLVPRPGTAASVASSGLRQGGDGDTVLFGSPSRKNLGIADAPAPPSMAASPYDPPSPPPGADPSPYMVSPTVAHPGSRLQHSSREDQEVQDFYAATEVAGASRPRGESEEAQRRRTYSGDTDTVTFAAGAAAASRPLSGVPGTSSAGVSRRKLTPPQPSSSTTSGVSFDLSLTAAAAAGGSRPTTGYGAGTASPVAAPTPASNVHGQPAYSSFSVADLSPSAASTPAGGTAVGRVASFDLEVDERGRPFSPSGSPRASTADAIGAVALASSVSGNRLGGQQQAQPTGLPLAAFSRAAALAAATDMGMAAPSTASERRSSQSPTGMPPSVAATPAARTYAAGGSAAGHEPEAAHTQPGQGQGPAPPSVAASSAKLSQLKARRQQQWQSQQGVHGSQAAADQPLLAHGVLPPPPDPANNHAALQQRQQHHHNQHAHHDAPNASYPANADRRSRYGVPPDASVSSSAWDASAASGGSRGLGGPAPSDSVAIHATPRTGAPQHTPAGASGQASMPPLPQPPSSLLPDAVGAIVRAASGSKEMAASGEFNLGHGISGLSVAIEAGAVKWAWQTGAKGAGAPGQEGVPGHAGASPGASSASPWASPGAGQATFGAAAVDAAHSGGGGARGGDSDGLGVHLPTPQWQRRGHAPAGVRVSGPGHEEYARELALMQQEAQQQQQLQHEEWQDQWQQELPGAQYAGGGQRRHTEHSNAAGADALVAAAQLEGPIVPQKEYAVSAGGAASSHGAGDTADGGAQAMSKAAALLRLKRQSIMRHVLAGSGQGPVDRQAPHDQQPHEAPPTASQQQHRASRVASAPTYRASQAHRQRQQASDQPPRVAYSRAWEHQPLEEADEGGEEEEDGAEGQAPAKPFLRRRSAKVQARKVDWSHVKPRTNSRNPDYYGDQQQQYEQQYQPQYQQHYNNNQQHLHQHPGMQQQQQQCVVSPLGNDTQSILKQRASPITSPRAGAAKPPLNVNIGSRAWKPGGKSPNEEERAAATAVAGRRRMSQIPAAPGYAAAPGYSAAHVGSGAGALNGGRGYSAGAGAGSVTRGSAAGAAAGGTPSGSAANPLDDLLQHVNTLLRDFDKIVR